MPLSARAPAGGVKGNETGKAAPPAEEPLTKTKDGGGAEKSTAEALSTGEKEATARDGAKAPEVRGKGAAELAGTE